MLLYVLHRFLFLFLFWQQQNENAFVWWNFPAMGNSLLVSLLMEKKHHPLAISCPLRLLTPEHTHTHTCQQALNREFLSTLQSRLHSDGKATKQPGAADNNDDADAESEDDDSFRDFEDTKPAVTFQALLRTFDEFADRFAVYSEFIIANEGAAKRLQVRFYK